MSCQMYEDYQLGKMSDNQFHSHLQTCDSCRIKQAQDDSLLDAARLLKEPVQAAGLWDRIEGEMLREKETMPSSHSIRFNRKTLFLIAAAFLMVAVSIGVFFGVFLERHGGGLLSKSALENVRQTENQYMVAIDQLEKKVLPQLEQMDIELVLLYKDRLAVIDSQIQQCKEALEQNPANSHIRHYMLAALQDKKETLTELLLPHNDGAIPGK